MFKIFWSGGNANKLAKLSRSPLASCFTKVNVSIADSLCRTLYGRGEGGTRNRSVLPMKLKCNSTLPVLHPRNLRERPRVSRRRIRTSRGVSALEREVVVGSGVRRERTGGLWNGLRIREWSGGLAPRRDTSRRTLARSLEEGGYRVPDYLHILI